MHNTTIDQQLITCLSTICIALHNLQQSKLSEEGLRWPTPLPELCELMAGQRPLLQLSYQAQFEMVDCILAQPCLQFSLTRVWQ